jgi:hypothetical protein
VHGVELIFGHDSPADASLIGYYDAKVSQLLKGTERLNDSGKEFEFRGVPHVPAFRELGINDAVSIEKDRTPRLVTLRLDIHFSFPATQVSATNQAHLMTGKGDT